MSQTRFESFKEAVTNNVIGFGYSWALNWMGLSLIAVMSLSGPWAAAFLTGIMTIASVVRIYILRRVFNARAR